MLLFSLLTLSQALLNLSFSISCLLSGFLCLQVSQLLLLFLQFLPLRLGDLLVGFCFLLEGLFLFVLRFLMLFFLNLGRLVLDLLKLMPVLLVLLFILLFMELQSLRIFLLRGFNLRS